MTGLTQELMQPTTAVATMDEVAALTAPSSLASPPVALPVARSVAKRAIDLLLASVGLLSLAPLLAIIAVAIVLDSGWPILYCQKRVGQGGQRFCMWKFRTMVRDAEKLKAALASMNEAPFPAFKVKNDPRVTRVGRFLRRTSMDELPQLWNVVRGQMSLVGPRPPLPEEVAHYDARARRRLDVRPGITCIWQIEDRHSRDSSTFADWVEKDLAYIERWSLALDFRLIWRTVLVLLRPNGQ